jgi:hypothetical protein
MAATKRRVLVFPVNAYRQGGRMLRYVPKGIVGLYAGNKYFNLNNCVVRGDIFYITLANYT